MSSKQEQSDKIVVKARSMFGDGEIRRFSVTRCIDYSQFFEILFGLYPTCYFSVKYVDDEGDEVLVTSDAELKEAIRLSSIQKPSMLRVFLCPESPVPVKKTEINSTFARTPTPTRVANTTVNVLEDDYLPSNDPSVPKAYVINQEDCSNNTNTGLELNINNSYSVPFETEAVTETKHVTSGTLDSYKRKVADCPEVIDGKSNETTIVSLSAVEIDCDRPPKFRKKRKLLYTIEFLDDPEMYATKTPSYITNIIQDLEKQYCISLMHDKAAFRGMEKTLFYEIIAEPTPTPFVAGINHAGDFGQSKTADYCNSHTCFNDQGTENVTCQNYVSSDSSNFADSHQTKKTQPYCNSGGSRFPDGYFSTD